MNRSAWSKVFTADPNAAWEKYGADDPYFGVLNQGAFKTHALDDASRASFFQSGEAYVDSVFRDIHQHLGQQYPFARALDFGCGVGRLVIPFAHRCTSVVGIDVSHHMLEEAQGNCEETGVANAEFVKSDGDWPEVSGTFDLIHSFIVFQHIPVKRGEGLLRAMLQRLRVGGVGVLHFTYHRKAPWLRKAVHSLRKSVPLVNQVVNVVQRKPLSYPMMQMNEYNLNHIFLTLQDHGCDRTFLRLTNHGGHLGVIVFFRCGEASVQ